MRMGIGALAQAYRSSTKERKVIYAAAANSMDGRAGVIHYGLSAPHCFQSQVDTPTSVSQSVVSGIGGHSLYDWHGHLDLRD